MVGVLENTMWFATLFIIFASAFGHESADVRIPADFGKDDAPIQGALALDNTVRNLGYRLDDVEVLQADYSQGIAAPSAAFASRRHQKWAKRFGKSKLEVRHRRLADNAILDQVTTEITAQDGGRTICATAVVADSDTVHLATFGDLIQTNTLPNLNDRQATRHQLFYVGDQNKRSAVAKLDVGESVTMVEVVGTPPKKQPKRKIKLRKNGHTMSITETGHHQQICINPTQP